eukprot:9494073-Pyramimonas_sp.AAC.1
MPSSSASTVSSGRAKSLVNSPPRCSSVYSNFPVASAKNATACAMAALFLEGWAVSVHGAWWNLRMCWAVGVPVRRCVKSFLSFRRIVAAFEFRSGVELLRHAV